MKITTKIKLINFSKNPILENNLSKSNIKFKYLNGYYYLSEISNTNIDAFLNIISWEILMKTDQKNKLEMIKNGYSNSFISIVSQSPFIALKIKEKILEYFINENIELDINKFIKFNLNNIDSVYEQFFNNISTTEESTIGNVLKAVLLKDEKYKEVKSIEINFISDNGINDFNCNIVTDNGLKVNSLSLDTSIQLYDLSSLNKKSKGILKHNLNAAVAAIISLKVKSVIFTGLYKEETINGIIKDVIKNGICNVDYKLN